MKEIALKELLINPVSLISDEWMLITAGNEQNGYNTMTACWGSIGAVWGHGKGLPSATVFIRPQRYTKEFVDCEPYYTLSFFPKEYKKALAYLGTHSGRDEDKIAKMNLTPVFDNNTTYFAEAKLVFICRKLYRASLLEGSFIDKNIMEDNYPLKDFHDMYIGEIVKIMVGE